MNKNLCSNGGNKQLFQQNNFIERQIEKTKDKYGVCVRDGLTQIV